MILCLGDVYSLFHCPHVQLSTEMSPVFLHKIKPTMDPSSQKKPLQSSGHQNHENEWKV